MPRSPLTHGLHTHIQEACQHGLADTARSRTFTISAGDNGQFWQRHRGQAYAMSLFQFDIAHQPERVLIALHLDESLGASAPDLSP